MERQLKKYAEKAGLPRHITPHALRHSIAVHYLIGGAPISFVQGLLGHESPSTGSGQAWRQRGSIPGWWIR
jgi:site-specific recombinase XerD